MLYATVRNRKIHVKSPTTIPRGSQNVDELLLDLDEEWDGMSKIMCIFSNLHTVEKVKKKVITTIETKVEEKKTEDDTVLSTTTTTDTSEEETEAEDDGKDIDETKVETTITEVEDTEAGTKTVTTITTTVTTERPVTRTEETTTSIEMSVTDNKATVPHDVLNVVGQMSVSIVGYGDNGNALMTTVLSDSFWDIVESGPTMGDESQEETASLYERTVAALGEAEKAAADAKAVADKLAQDAENGAFDGSDGKDGRDGETPRISIGTVKTVSSSESAKVTASGTPTNVVLNFEIPKGEQGSNTPIKGVDYFTSADVQEIVQKTLAALPDGDGVAY